MDFRARQLSNRRKSAFLLSAMSMLLVGIVYLFGTVLGLSTLAIAAIAGVVSVLGVWGSWFASDRIALSMTGARLVDQSDAPQLYNLVNEVALAAGMPMPRVAIVDDPAPNAFATGRDPEHGVVAFTTGIIELLDREELQGVAAHEMSHIANRDTLVAAVAATTAGAIAILTDLVTRMLWFSGGRRRSSEGGPALLALALVMLVLSSVAALLLQAAVSRSREALADASGVAFTRNPAGLRSALEKLAVDSTVVEQRSNALAHLWIESPLDGSRASRFFATHPPIADRIEALRAMEH